MRLEEITKSRDVVPVLMRDHDMFDSRKIYPEALDVLPENILSAKGVKKNIPNQEGYATAQCFSVFLCGALRNKP